MRICPRCTKVPEEQSAEGVTVEGCPGYGGAWFDRGELDTVARRDPNALVRIDQTFRPARGELPPPYSSMRCPVCVGPLDYFEFRHFPEIGLNGCKKCRGVRADNGDLEQIAARILRTDVPQQDAT